MLITGATGTVGGGLVARYHSEFRVHAQGRDGQKLLALAARFPSVKIILGDLTSPRVREAMTGAAVVIHAAAQKYVDLAESNVAYTLDTNISRTRELAELAAAVGVRRFLFISTDKSSSPTNVYGMSKYLGERIILEVADACPATAFVVCRFGNVFGSNGSVIRLWQAAVAGGRPIRVSDPEMTRFMFPAAEAADLVEFARTRGETGDVIIPKMRAVLLADLIGLFPGAEVAVTGPRPGEKPHETLYVRGELATGYETDRYFVLNRRATTPVALDTMISSSAERVSPAELREWLAALDDGEATRAAA